MSDILYRHEILASGVDKESACHQEMRDNSPTQPEAELRRDEAPTPAELSEWLAVCAAATEGPYEQPEDMCRDCAFRLGSEPNRSYTAFDALKCLMEGIEFECHHGEDKRCVGFQRAVERQNYMNESEQSQEAQQCVCGHLQGTHRTGNPTYCGIRECECLSFVPSQPVGANVTPEIRAKARAVVDGFFAKADAAYSDCKVTHVLFLQVRDEHDNRHSSVNLGTVTRETIIEVLAKAIADAAEERKAE